MIKQGYVLLLGVFSLLAAVGAQAGEGEERLRQFFAQTTKLQTEFKQTVTNAQGKVVQKGEGIFSLQRPGKFRWDYRQPYEQLIISDGVKLWIYDVDLEQVTVKALDEALGNSPAQLLSSNRDIGQDFSLQELGEKDGLLWVKLTSKSRDVSFEEVRMAFAGKELRIMELVDNFGQTTQLSFHRQVYNPTLPADTFRFVPPAGIDIIGE